MCIQKKCKQQQVYRLWLLAVVLFIALCSSKALGQDHSSWHEPSKLIINGSYLVGTKGHEFGHRENELFLPASTLKILTSLAAFHLLGPEYRFETHIYLGSNHNLYIKGYGDPFLTSEEILRLSLTLYAAGIRNIKKVFLDYSAFELETDTPGSGQSSNPYDAPNGALAVNFNSLAVTKHPNGTVESAEPQTPTLPIMQGLAKYLRPGKQRINIDLLPRNSKLPSAVQYAGELFLAQLKKAGVMVEEGFERGTTPAKLSPVLRYKNSKTLQEMMKECLHYSNNFIANQVFLHCGAVDSGAPATWEKSQHFIENFLIQQLSISPAEFSIYDGSGLSRNNQITAQALVTIIRAFTPYKTLLTSENGTLLKSGTLEGVYCYVGYLTHHDNTIPFAILLNQKNNKRDQVLRAIQRLYLSPK